MNTHGTKSKSSSQGSSPDLPLVVDNVYPVYETASPQVASAYYSDSDLYLDAEPAAKEPTAPIPITSPRTGRMSTSSQGSGVGWLVYPGKAPAGITSPSDWVDTLAARTMQAETEMQTETDMQTEEPFGGPIPEATEFVSSGVSPSQHCMMLCPSPRKPSMDDSRPIDVPKRHIFSPDMMAAEEQYCMDVENLPQAMELCLSPPLDRITIYSPDTMILRGIQFDHCM